MKISLKKKKNTRESEDRDMSIKKNVFIIFIILTTAAKYKKKLLNKKNKKKNRKLSEFTYMRDSWNL